MQRSYYTNQSGYHHSVHSTESPMGKVTEMRTTGHGLGLGPTTHIASQQHPLSYSRTHIEYVAPPSPGHMVTSMVKHSHGSPGRMISTMSPPLSPVRTAHLGSIGGAPGISMLKMTSSPQKKNLTTTRTNFQMGMTTTEELASDPYGGVPIPMPGETVAVTRTSGFGGVSAQTHIDSFGGATSVLRENKSPVRTYTTTIYEDGEIPRTYTTTFEDQPALAPPRVHTTNSTTTFGVQNSYVSEHRDAFGGSQVHEHHTTSPVSEHRTTTTVSPGRCTKVTSTRAGFGGVHTQMGYI